MELIKKNVGTLAFILTVTVLLVFTTWSTVKKNKEKEVLESAAGEALMSTSEKEQYTDMAGNSAVLSDYLGEVLVVNSWASWSPFSSKELAELSLLVGAYNDHGVKILAINRAEQSETAERYLKTVDGHESIILILDPDDNFYRSVEGYTMPETLFYDKKGNIVHHNRGPMTQEQVRHYIEKALTLSDEE